MYRIKYPSKTPHSHRPNTYWNGHTEPLCIHIYGSRTWTWTWTWTLFWLIISSHLLALFYKKVEALLSGPFYAYHLTNNMINDGEWFRQIILEVWFSSHTQVTSLFFPQVLQNNCLLGPHILHQLVISFHNHNKTNKMMN